MMNIFHRFVPNFLRSRRPEVLIILILTFQQCSDSSPHKVILSKVTDNFGTTTALTYDNSNHITSITKTFGSKVETTELTYQGDSAILVNGIEVTVIKYQGTLPVKEYSYLKPKPDSIYTIIKFRLAGGTVSSSVFISKDPALEDSTVTLYTWKAGNIVQMHNKYYRHGGVVWEPTINCSYDNGNNFSNGDYLFFRVLGFEGKLFTLCANNLVSTNYSDNSLAICCYEFSYNSNHYPSGIKGVQLDTYRLEYIDPH